MAATICATLVMTHRFVLRLANGRVHTFGGGFFGGDIDKIVGAIDMK